MLPDSSTRLNKYISESGICSRREADRYIEQGNVFINGKRATIGDQVNPGDVVKVNGQLIEPREAEDLVFIALNKPVGIVSTTEDSERDNIVDFVNHSKRVFPIGRLDKDSQGLIFLTIVRRVSSVRRHPSRQLPTQSPSQGSMWMVTLDRGKWLSIFPDSSSVTRCESSTVIPGSTLR